MPPANPLTRRLLIPEMIEPARIDRMFESLRLATGLQLGYAQIYLRPIGWAWGFDADLPTVIDPAPVRRYPPSFNNYAWNEPPAKLTAAHLEDSAQMHTALVSAEPRIKLAARRFGKAQLRDNTEDAVLDLCIALEAGLGDSGRSEMTHKVAMRAAALLAPARFPPEDIKRLVRRLYGWRSALVHGDDAERPIRRFIGEGRSEAEAIARAPLLVQRVLSSLLQREDLAQGEDLDDAMLQALVPPQDDEED